MKKIYFTPGPSHIFPTVPTHLRNAITQQVYSWSHRGKQFQLLYEETTTLLKELLSIPDSYYIFFLSSGTEAMERIIQNCVDKKSFHFVNGAFAKRFYEASLQLGKKPTMVETPFGTGFEFSKITIPKKSELICITQNETSTGVFIDPKEITKLTKTYPEKILAVDIVSSIPYVQLEYKHTDCVFFSVQKGFGLPAGLGIVIISPRALEKAQYLEKRGVSIGSYHSFTQLAAYSEKNQTSETPNVLELFLLHAVLKDLQKKGIETIRKETDEKAQMLYNFFEKNSNRYTIFVKKKNERSPTVVVVEVNEGSKKIIEKGEKKGIVIGEGYGKHKESHLRISNFPAITLKETNKLIRILS